MTQTRPTRISLCWSVSLDWERESRIKHLKLCTLKVIVSHFPGPVFAGSGPSENRLSGHPESCQQMSPVLEVARVGAGRHTRKLSQVPKVAPGVEVGQGDTLSVGSAEATSVEEARVLLLPCLSRGRNRSSCCKHRILFTCFRCVL